ncbi:CrcB family protein [Auritidibacter sp. NML130574]|nr:CrcB family protein [Auritidibacter sp. NML130574]
MATTSTHHRFSRVLHHCLRHDGLLHHRSLGIRLSRRALTCHHCCHRDAQWRATASRCARGRHRSRAVGLPAGFPPLCFKAKSPGAQHRGVGVIAIAFVVAAFFGAVTRYVADVLLPRYGILLANIAGSAIAGVVGGLILGYADLAEQARLIWITALAGSLTTFSTVSMSTAHHVMAGSLGRAVGTWTLHIVASLAVATLGFTLAITSFS